MKNLIILFMLIIFTMFSSFAQVESYTCKLSQSTPSYTFWTTTPSVKIFKNSPVPQAVDSSIKVYCAKNETEPFVVVVKPVRTETVSITMGSFSPGIETELYCVKYVPITTPSDNLGKVGPYPDPLFPLQNNSSVTLNADEQCAFWISLYVPDSIKAGDYKTSLAIGGVALAVKLHVFNFTLPSQLHIGSQMNFSYESILSKYGVSGMSTDYWMYVDKINNFFIRHRLTPRNPLWPGGLTRSGGANFINYDCNVTISDQDGIWGFEQPADKYIKGKGFNNGTGFPVFQAATFSNNDASSDQRPETFCATTRNSSDWYTGTNAASDYNKIWFQYIKTLQDYLSNRQLLDKAYYYFANEPQDQADYDAIAWYSGELKKAAPQLKLMISEEPRPEIYNHPLFTGAKIDIWLPVLNNYNPDISGEREKNFGEQTWIYFLHSTRPPYFNPITLDHPGIECKLTGWFLWKFRLKGIAYYALNDWSKNPWSDPLTDGHNGDLFMLYPPSQDNNPIAFGSTNHQFCSSVRFELMRDGLEDFEYLYLLNGNKMPDFSNANPADIYANKIISGLISYCRDDEFTYNLRHLIGSKLSGEIETIPDINPSNLHPRSLGTPGNYFINFQDPAAEPKANPLIVNGDTYLKIGWSPYNDSLGYGWYGDMSHVMYSYINSAPNELQRSIIYDDWGRQKTFEFDCPDGVYSAEVSVGWQGKGYKHQKVTIEGVPFVNDEETTVANPYLVKSKQISISDKKCTMEIGLFDEYTMLNYLTLKGSGAELIHLRGNSASHGKLNIVASHSVITFYIDGTLPDVFEIYDLSGRMILRQQITSSQHSVSRGLLHCGVYTCSFRKGHKTMQTMRILVR